MHDAISWHPCGSGHEIELTGRREKLELFYEQKSKELLFVCELAGMNMVREVLSIF